MELLFDDEDEPAVEEVEDDPDVEPLDDESPDDDPADLDAPTVLLDDERLSVR